MGDRVNHQSVVVEDMRHASGEQSGLPDNVLSTPLLSLDDLRQHVHDEDIALMLYDAVVAFTEFLKHQVAPRVKERKHVYLSKEPFSFPFPFESPRKSLNCDSDSSTLDPLAIPCISLVLHKILQNGDSYPPVFDQLLKDLATYGICRIPWCLLRMILLLKSEQVLLETLPDKDYSLKAILDGLCPLRVSVGHLWKLSLAPFTIQRTAEFLLSYKPVKSQRAALKFMYSLTKTINFASIWLHHDIPAALLDFEKLLQSDEEASCLLTMLNPGLISNSFFSSEPICPISHSDASGDARQMNDEEEDATTPHFSTQFSQHTDPTRAGRRRSRNSFEVYTPRRGCSAERLHMGSESEDLPDNALCRTSIESEAKCSSGSNISIENPNYSLLDDDEEEEEEEEGEEEEERVSSASPSQHHTLDMKSVKNSDSLTDSRCSEYDSENRTSSTGFPGPIKSAKAVAWQEKLVSINDQVDNGIFRPSKRVKIQSFSDMSYTSLNYPHNSNGPQKSHSFDYDNSMTSLYGVLKHEENDTSPTHLVSQNSSNIYALDLDHYDVDQETLVTPHKECSILDPESLSFLKQLRSSPCPSETCHVSPKDYFTDFPDSEHSHEPTFNNLQAKGGNGDVYLDSSSTSQSDSKVSDTSSEATKLLSNCLRGSLDS